jgi:cysteinyl-tRNA synthetase
VLAFEPEASAVPPEIQALLDARALARKNRDWATSDKLRDELAALGWEVKDTKEGQVLTPRNKPA